MSSSRNIDESCHLGVWLFHDNAPQHKSLVAQQALGNCEFVQPSCLQSRLGSQWLLFPNKKSEAPSSWNLVYRWWITEDRCRGMAWVSKQKFIFKAKTAQKTSWKSTLMLVENMNMSKNDSMCDITCSYLQPSSKTCWSPLVHVP